jgi:cytochrome P450
VYGIEIENLSLQDLLRPDILANPYPVFRRLRLEDPIHEDPTGQGWIISRYDDVAFVLGDHRFSAERTLPKGGESTQMNPVQAALARQMLFLDPPDHTRLRTLFTKAFTPNRVESLRPQILEMTTDLLNAAQGADGCIDFVHDFAVPLPVTVIAQMLGVPVADRDRLRAWSVAFGKLISGRTLSHAESLEAQQGILAFIQYFRELIDQRRQRPESDMLSDLIAVEEMGDRLSTEELIVNLILLLAAGHGTTTHLLGNGLLALSQNPRQWQLLAHDPGIAPSAVSELLRFDGPVQSTVRNALEDVHIGGKTIAQGQRVTVLLGSTNRDEVRFPDPDTLDLRRSGARILAFGHGIHTCLGASLARLEAQIAFSELARRFPNLLIEIETPERVPSIHFRGLQKLPVTLVRNSVTPEISALRQLSMLK